MRPESAVIQGRADVCQLQHGMLYKDRGNYLGWGGLTHHGQTTTRCCQRLRKSSYSCALKINISFLSQLSWMWIPLTLQAPWFLALLLPFSLLLWPPSLTGPECRLRMCAPRLLRFDLSRWLLINPVELYIWLLPEDFSPSAAQTPTLDVQIQSG